MLIACIGQSNMREWFHTGQRPSALTPGHASPRGPWIEPTTAGNGALAAGNRLAAALKIPVGLLDYSVNGTGLTAKAEWGKGFWLDTGPNGIYRRWVDGVNTTGGSVEYVVWMQGEADAARGTVSREEYRTALERLVNDQIRSDIKNGSSRPQLPFLIIPLVKRPTWQGYHLPVDPQRPDGCIENHRRVPPGGPELGSGKPRPPASGAGILHHPGYPDGPDHPLPAGQGQPTIAARP
jgi:hypothetical protein